MAKRLIKSIVEVAANGLCTNCGTCAGTCPENAIRMDQDYSNGCYYPKLDDERCNNCGLCFRVCPGHFVDFRALNFGIFCKEPEDILMGNYQACYLGHATDNDIRYNAASGGLVTTLLLFALEKGIITGALVTRMKKDKPLEPEPFIARSREEIIEGSKSKYCPVPANIILKEILNSKEGEKFAVVGLPCHIHGVRKAQSANKSLKEKVVLHFGIFCSHTDTFWQTEFLLNKLGLKKEAIAKIDYRGEGWPGSMSVLLKDGRKVSVPYAEGTRLHGLWLYALPRCALCYDLTAELADVSCGDAWLPEVLANEQMGKSIAIARSDTGEALCREAVQNGYVELKELDTEKVKQSGDMMRTKKTDIKVRFLIRRLFNKAVPIYSAALLQPGPINYVRGMVVYFNTWISSKKYLRRFIAPLSRIELMLISCFNKPEDSPFPRGDSKK
ncbi:Coenzyme F420 hydrogenase/dehydrogenase, beta subunit C-terminal domain [candidate division NPL-UPA2 bacterium]|nr:Coenzyme F420 hydrogenase/dehydrogenase, beta subunit C-terminal domain [candidate division NPL-UPA2 bacterium]